MPGFASLIAPEVDSQMVTRRSLKLLPIEPTAEVDRDCVSLAVPISNVAIREAPVLRRFPVVRTSYSTKIKEDFFRLN